MGIIDVCNSLCIVFLAFLPFLIRKIYGNEWTEKKRDKHSNIHRVWVVYYWLATFANNIVTSICTHNITENYENDFRLNMTICLTAPNHIKADTLVGYFFSDYYYVWLFFFLFAFSFSFSFVLIVSSLFVQYLRLTENIWTNVNNRWE